MKIEFLCSLFLLPILLLVGCEKLVEKPRVTSSTEPISQNTYIGEKTKVIKGKDLKGAQLNAVDEQGKKLNFEIKDVELDPKDPEKETYLYTVFYVDSANSQGKNLCTPDAENVAKAIPLTGSWDETGAHTESSNIITFGCTSGVLAKCVRMGYKPWKTVKGTSLRDYHQACTRMARADYCGNGKSHTRDGTPINIYDKLGIQKKTPHDGMVFEAAWSPEGATFINRPRWFETVSEIRQECPNKLKGRINEGGSWTTAEKVKQNQSGSLLFNDSLIKKRL
ncbi:hypothetical protein H6F74_28350 [Trichocoleus sp. FACHB-90]|uniref:ADYC domain-containing protein n=1 Tax=Cyanophyceae TaxID=3028117 RepID=UPI0016885481|nr:ADYC domain-containing protein [Trichocoleus sp. FACHB-90]MBD1930102.1 hypothetical protein [Trichocoleus sp. FACHB-90]